MTLAPDRLAALAAKYEALGRLRREHDAGQPPPPKATFVELAARFPGALKELDRLALSEIDARAETLADAARGARPVEPWMRVQDAYHLLLREGLHARANRANADATAALSRRLEHASVTLRGGDVERLVHDRDRSLVRVATELVAAAFSWTPDDVRALVSGARVATTVASPRAERAPHGPQEPPAGTSAG